MRIDLLLFIAMAMSIISIIYFLGGNPLGPTFTETGEEFVLWGNLCISIIGLIIEDIARRNYL